MQKRTLPANSKDNWLDKNDGVALILAVVAVIIGWALFAMYLG